MAKNATVAVKFTGDVADLKRATGEAEREMESFGSRVGPKLKTAMAGAGVAAGAVLVDSFMTAMDQETSTARMGASLGLSDEEAERLGKTAGDIYAAGWGESFDGVTTAVGQVVSTLEDLDPGEVEGITTKALALADVFQLDVQEAVSAVGFMIRNNLVRDATEGFDVITAALQKLPAEMRSEALEAISEYGVSFGALGYNGSEAMALIIEAAQNTSVGVDKVGDAVKEFLIRSTDGSTLTVDALEALNLEAGEIATAIAAGGPAAEEAFQRVVTALLSVEDPAYRAQLSVALFGTPVEDLAVNKLPEFLTALQNAEGGLGDVEGKAGDVTDAMDTNQATVEAWKRKWQQSLVDFLAETVIPSLEDLDENFGLTMRLIGSYIQDAATTVITELDNMTDAFGGPIGGAKDLLELLGRIAGDKALNAAADALGVKRSDKYVLLPPAEFDKRKNGGYTGTNDPAYPRAMGGPVSAGERYLTGERGPEVFVPDVDGMVVPNSQLGGANVTVNNYFTHSERAEDVTVRSIRKARLALGMGG